MKYLTTEWGITIEEDVENDEDKLKIYEGNYKAWDLSIIGLTDIPFGLFRQCDENSHEACEAIIDTYEASYEKQ